MLRNLIDTLKEKYLGKKVLVVGLGLQAGGVGLVRFFSELGAHVTVTDKKSAEILSPSVEQLKNLPVTFHLATE